MDATAQLDLDFAITINLHYSEICPLNRCAIKVKESSV